MALQWQNRTDISDVKFTADTPYLALSVRMRILKKFDHVLTAPHCIRIKAQDNDVKFDFRIKAIHEYVKGFLDSIIFLCGHLKIMFNDCHRHRNSVAIVVIKQYLCDEWPRIKFLDNQSYWSMMLVQMGFGIEFKIVCTDMVPGYASH